MQKRVISLLLCLCMAVSLLSATAWAAGPTAPVGATTGRPQDAEEPAEPADAPAQSLPLEGKVSPNNQIETQQSGLDLERTSDGATETAGLPGGEGYAVREDEDEVATTAVCEDAEGADPALAPGLGEGNGSSGETEQSPEQPSTPPASADAEPTSPVEGRQDDEDEEVALLYTYSGTYAGLHWSLDTSTGVLFIYGLGAWQSDYSNSATPWESYKSSIKTVNIGNSVTSIGAYAFRNCTGLTSVTIPDSVTTIDRDAFNGCTGLTSVTIPDSVTSIEVWAFSRCTGLTSITIPDSVTSIGGCAFYGCTGLTSITIPDSVTSIGNRMFYGCTGLTEVTLTNSVTSIGDYAFYGCHNLTSVTIGNSVTSIGNDAFSGCRSLTSVTIGNSVTSIGEWAFSGCTNLTNVIYYGTSTQWSSITIGSANTPLKNAAKQFTMLSGICGANVTWLLDIITGVLTISGEGPMAEYSKGSPAPWYEHRENIQTVVIESGVTTVGGSAFRDCENLTAVTIPAGVTVIGASAFYHCYRLTEIEIPAGVTSLGANVFSGCTGLESVTIPNSVTNIGNYGFYNCSALIDVTYKGTEEQWNAVSIGTNNEPLTSAAIRFAGEDPVERLLGDVSGDGVVNGKDISILRRYIVGGYDMTVDETVADVNHDGVVSGKDITHLRRYLVGGYGVTLE